MRKIVIASHHLFAYGLTETVKFLSGYENLYDLSAYVDSEVKIEEQIDSIMKKINVDDEVFIFTDMLGGSVTQKFYNYMNEKIHIICGMNLPLILTIALQGEEELSSEKIEGIIEESKQQIIYINNHEVETSDDDE